MMFVGTTHEAESPEDVPLHQQMWARIIPRRLFTGEKPLEEVAARKKFDDRTKKIRPPFSHINNDNLYH